MIKAAGESYKLVFWSLQRIFYNESRNMPSLYLWPWNWRDGCPICLSGSGTAMGTSMTGFAGFCHWNCCCCCFVCLSMAVCRGRANLEKYIKEKGKAPKSLPRAPSLFLNAKMKSPEDVIANSWFSSSENLLSHRISAENAKCSVMLLRCMEY